MILMTCEAGPCDISGFITDSLQLECEKGKALWAQNAFPPQILLWLLAEEKTLMTHSISKKNISSSIFNIY